MNQRYFLAVMSIRNYANDIKKRVKSVESLDETGIIYRVNYWGGDFQEFRLSMENSTIVYLTELNQSL